MNQRIQELANHAELYVDLYGKPWPRAMSAEEADAAYKKFAELIVEECIWALWTEECRTSDLASEEYTRGSNKIKQHFGVEE